MMVNLASLSTNTYLLHMKICMMATGTLTYLQTLKNFLNIIRMLIGYNKVSLMDTYGMRLY